ncbi:MAG: uridylate kinase [Pseudomonadota bacterium]
MTQLVQAKATASAVATAPPTVVKLGGSIIRGPHLAHWLETIAGAKGPIVVVPGGGALADEVRQCQHQLGFDDVTAHRMALLAMDQLAWAISGLRSGFEVGSHIEELRTILRRGQIAVWAPSTFLAGRTDIKASWQLTSDSLALWLSAKIDARLCAVIKSVTFTRSKKSVQGLTQDGIVDAAFPGMLAESRIPTAIFGRGDEAAFCASLAGDASTHHLALA